MREIPLFERRQIEAGVLVPLIRALREKFGNEPVDNVVRAVIRDLASQTGKELTSEIGGPPLEILEAILPIFNEGGTLEIEPVARDESRYDFDVRRCRFAEFYRELGVPELGLLLSCERDFALARGIDPNLELTRTQTIMEGATHCDFRFRFHQAARSEDELTPSDDADSKRSTSSSSG